MDDFVRRSISSTAYAPYAGIPNLPYQEYRKHVARDLPDGCVTACHPKGPYFNPILMKLMEDPPENTCSASPESGQEDYYRQCDPNASQPRFDEIGEAVSRVALRFPSDVFSYYQSVVNGIMGFGITNQIFNTEMPYWFFLMFMEDRSTYFPVRTIGRLLKASYLVEMKQLVIERNNSPDRSLMGLVMEKLSENRMYDCIIKYWGPVIRLDISSSDQHVLLDRLEWNAEEIFVGELKKIFTIRHLSEVIVEFIENPETLETINQRWNDFATAFLDAIRLKVEGRLAAALGE